MDWTNPLITFTVLTLLSIQIGNVSPAKILVWEAIGTHSTRISITPLMDGLVAKGHEVSLLSNFQDPDKSSKIKPVVAKKWRDGQGTWEGVHSFFSLRKDPLYIPKLYILELRESGILACEMLYEDEEFVAWAKAQTFDMVIVESAWNECAYGWVHYWKAKSVIFGTSTLFPHMTEPFGVSDESSVIGDMLFGFPSTRKSPMKYWQRFLNAFASIGYDLTRKWWYLPELEEITRKGLGLTHEQLPTFTEIERNVTLVLLSTHYSFGPTRSYPPNVIPVGGAVVSKKLKPLPKEMEEFIKTADKGFIFISFGTVVEFTNFDDDVQKEFIAGLAKFPEIKFVWKSSDPIKHPLPDNVFVASWAPQQSLLAHPKIKAFISHVGQGSTNEIISFAVPVICVPVLCDQDVNADLFVERDAGVKLEVLTLKSEELEWAIKEILYNDKYRKGMKQLAQLFKDRPLSPVEESVWWVEYALRHDNINDILRPPLADQPWWMRRQLDVWFLTALLLLAFIVIPLCLIKAVVKRLLKSNKTGGKLKKS